MLRRWLKLYTNNRLVGRFFSLWITGIVIMGLFWIVSYRELPQGILQDKFLVSVLDFTFSQRLFLFLEIFIYNLLLVCVPIIISNLFRVKSLPLGYIITLYHWGLYGLLLGTNSFFFTSGEGVVPSLNSLVSGIGFYELSSYTIIATSTISLSTGNLKVIFRNVDFPERLGMVIGFIMLFFSNLCETLSI